MSKFPLPIALAFATALTPFAQAQTTQPAKPTTVNVDGKAAAAMTVGGKTYVSVDALKAAGLNVQNSKIFLLTNPTVGQPAYKLSGCMNEWLWNGATRMRIDKIELENYPTRWLIYITTQTALGNLNEYYTENRDTAILFSNGDLIKIGNPAWVSMRVNFITQYANTIQSTDGIGVYRSDTESPSDPPVKLSIPQIRISNVTYPAMTFDLTCKK